MSPLIHIVLDTSVLYEDYELVKAPLRELLNIAKLCHARVLLPKIVFDEHVVHFERDYKRYRSQTKTAFDKLRQLPLVDVPSVNIPEVGYSYSDLLRAITEERGLEILNYPQVDHENILRRSFEQRKPFGKKDAGYKDALIWETILELLSDSSFRVIFVTANYRDFGESSSGPLDRQLVHELEDRGLTRDCVQLKLSLKEASDYLRKESGLTAAALIDAVAEQIKENVNFDELLTNHIREIEECIDSDSEGIMSGADANESSLYWNVEDSEVKIETTEVLDDGEVVVYAEAEFENEVVYHMFLSEYYTEDDWLARKGVSLYEADEDMDVAQVGGSMVLSLEFSFVYNPISHNVSGFEALEIHRVDIGEDEG